MSVWVISDFHLSLRQPFVPGQPPLLYKPMADFGSRWANHVQCLYDNFQEMIKPEDTVFVPGDISWATKIQEARHDFAFLGALPGRMVISKGNHDFWWDTKSKAQRFMPPNISLIQNEAWQAEGIAAAATRGWYCPGSQDFDEESAKLYRRECLRLEMALQAAAKMNEAAGGGLEILALLHFPPVNDKWEYNEMIELMQKYQVRRCFYGHLHGAKTERALQGSRWQIEFALISTDYLGHRPRLISR